MISRSGLTTPPYGAKFGKQAIRGMSGNKLGTPAVVAAIVLLLVASPLRAEDRVPVPAACRALAVRAGIPLTLTHAEAARSVAYIRAVASQDPMVARCRRALGNY